MAEGPLGGSGGSTVSLRSAWPLLGLLAGVAAIAFTLASFAAIVTIARLQDAAGELHARTTLRVEGDTVLVEEYARVTYDRPVEGLEREMAVGEYIDTVADARFAVVEAVELLPGGERRKLPVQQLDVRSWRFGDATTRAGGTREFLVRYAVEGAVERDGEVRTVPWNLEDWNRSGSVRSIELRTESPDLVELRCAECGPAVDGVATASFETVVNGAGFVLVLDP